MSFYFEKKRKKNRSVSRRRKNITNPSPVSSLFRKKKKKLARETRDMMYRAFLYRNISVVECRPIKQLPNLPTYRAQESPRYVVSAGVKTYRGIKTIAAERRERGKKALVTELVRKLNLEKKKFLLVTRNRFTGAQTFRR